MPSASESDRARDFTVASFNAHWGVGRYGAERGVRFDVADIVRRFDADIVVVPEAWRDDAGVNVVDALRDDGYTIETVELMQLRLRVRTQSVERGSVPRDGTWELAICSRFPILDRRLITMGKVRRDAPGERRALALTVLIGDTPVEVIGLHTSSKVWRLAPVQHLARLRRGVTARGPQIMAGDFNFWGWPVVVLMRGWRRSVRGRTFPARTPRHQIDHVLVRGGIEILGGEVLAETPSDHRPVRARLRLPAVEHN